MASKDEQPQHQQHHLLCTTTSWLAVGGVAAAMLVYGVAGVEALLGRVPGPYVSLLTLAPLGFLANHAPLLINVVKSILPSRVALAAFALAVGGAIAFQAAVSQRAAPAVIVALALFNLSVYAYAVIRQKRLDRTEQRLKCIGT